MAKRVFSFKHGINIQPVITLPTNAETGDIIYLLSENVFKYYDGSQWLDFAPTTINNLIAGENIPARTPVYISPGAPDGGRTAGRIYICSDGTNTIRSKIIGLTKTAVTTGNSVAVVSKGAVDGFSLLTLGVPVFWDGTALQYTEPTTSQSWIRIGAVNSTTSIIVDPTIGMRVPNSSELVTLDAPQTLSNKNYENARLTKQVYNEVAVDSTLTGTNATLDPTANVIILTNSGLLSIEAINEIFTTSPITASGRITVINRTGNTLIFKNNSGSVLTRRIINGNGDDLEIENENSISFLYDTHAQRWKVAGGGASGSLSIVKTAGENLSQYIPVYISKGNANGDPGRTAGHIYTLDPTNDHRMEYIGLVKTTVTAGIDVGVQLTGRVNLPVSLIQGGSFINGEMVYWDGSQYTTTAPTNTDFWLIKVGKAVSNQEMVINPDLGASAIYVPAPSAADYINNNVTSPAVLGISFNPISVSAFKIHYQITRIAGSTELVESGVLSGHYNSNLGQWTLVNYGISSDAQVEFTMVGNNLAYTSSNMTGSPYSGTFLYNIETQIEPAFDFSSSIANNVTSYTNVVGLLLPPARRSISMFYMIRRIAGSTELAESGIINIVRNVTSSTCDISVSGVSGDAEVNFDVTSGGQVRYISSNMIGSPYSGNIYWEIISEL